MIIASKILVFILMFSILIVIKEAFLFVTSFMANKSLDMSVKRQVILGCSISYILTIIFTGLSLL